MKNTIKKVMALLAAILLVGQLGATVRADDTPAPPVPKQLTQDTTGSITVKANSVEEGTTINVYKLMNVHFDDKAGQPAEPVYTWVNGVANWVRDNFSTYIGEENDNAVTENFQQENTDSTKNLTGEAAAKFYDQLSAAIRSGAFIGFNPTKTAKAVKGQNTVIDSLPMGNYLVLIEGGMNIYKPSAVNLIPTWNEEARAWQMTEAVVTVKSSTPTFDKTIDQAKTDMGKSKSASVGDTISYTIVSDVPNYPANATAHYWSIYDKLSEGLTYQPTSLKVIGIKSTATGGSSEAGSTTNTEVDITKQTEGDGALYTQPDNELIVGVKDNQNITIAKSEYTFGLQLDPLKIAAAGFGKIKVTYSAVLNEKAKVIDGTDDNKVGNTNDAKMAYNNNPYDPSSYKTKEPGTTPTVYTYEIDLTKIKKGDSNTKLGGAQFTLAPADAEGKTGTAYKFTKDADGVYEISTDADASAALETGSEGSSLGVLKVKGLAEGTYILTETKAPSGYIKAKDPQTITLTGVIDKTTGELTGLLQPEEEGENPSSGIKSISFENSNSFLLPTTGGLGTILFSAFGILIAAAGIYVVVTAVKHRKA